MVLVLISVIEVFGLPHQGASRTAFQPFLNSFHFRRPSSVMQSFAWALFQAKCKIQCKRAAWFLNSFFATRTTLCLTRTVFLTVSKNHTIHNTTFVLTLNDTENIPLSENIVVVSVLFTTFPHFHPKIQIVDWQGSATRRWQYEPYGTLFNVESLSCVLSTRFEPIYTNVYHIGKLDGTVSQ